MVEHGSVENQRIGNFHTVKSGVLFLRPLHQRFHISAFREILVSIRIAHSLNRDGRVVHHLRRHDNQQDKAHQRFVKLALAVNSQKPAVGEEQEQAYIGEFRPKIVFV